MEKTNKDKFVVLFVCTGNTCRSPMAEGLLRKMLRDRDVKNLKVGSVGICGWEDMLASPFAIEVARLRGVDLSRHRSQQLTKKMVQEADLILAMSQEHINYIRRIDPKAGDKTHLLKIFLKSHPASNEDQNQGVLFIKDPIGGTLGDYERSFLEIEKEIKRIFPKLLSLVNKR
jgi:protein-tyrosine-phosphatase